MNDQERKIKELRSSMNWLRIEIIILLLFIVFLIRGYRVLEYRVNELENPTYRKEHKPNSDMINFKMTMH